jgi:transcriptional regulator with XRE-family HTH domain
MADAKFAAWVKRYGVNKLASKLEVHRSTIFRWLKNEHTPSKEHRKAIRELAGRKLNTTNIVV